MVRAIVSVYFVLLFTDQAGGSDVAISQVNTVLSFYETLASEQPPSFSDFNKLFGPHDKSEIEMILRVKFPSYDFSDENWQEKHPDALNHVNSILKEPEKNPSLFLQCIKSKAPDLFSKHVKRRLEFPPEVKEDIRRYSIMTSGKRVIFVFSQDEQFIETIYLPDGKDIHTLMPSCLKISKK